MQREIDAFGVFRSRVHALSAEDELAFHVLSRKMIVSNLFGWAREAYVASRLSEFILQSSQDESRVDALADAFVLDTRMPRSYKNMIIKGYNHVRRDFAAASEKVRMLALEYGREYAVPSRQVLDPTSSVRLAGQEVDGQTLRNAWASRFV